LSICRSVDLLIFLKSPIVNYISQSFNHQIIK
jgi:hypothetical protein